jgi:hypothetical protein
MADTPLLVAMHEYRSQLEQHLVALRERHQQLQAAWFRLREIYAGDGAEVFSEAFETASRRLEDYAAGGLDIMHQLERKIDELRRFQASGPTV